MHVDFMFDKLLRVYENSNKISKTINFTSDLQVCDSILVYLKI